LAKGAKRGRAPENQTEQGGRGGGLKWYGKPEKKNRRRGQGKGKGVVEEKKERKGGYTLGPPGGREGGGGNQRGEGVGVDKKNEGKRENPKRKREMEKEKEQVGKKMGLK